MSNQFDMQLFLRATVSMYWDCIYKATQQLIRTWIVIPASIASYFVFIQLAMLFPPGFGSGLILGLIQVIFLTFYYNWLHESVVARRLKLDDLIQFNSSLFYGIINVGFILFIATFIVQTLTRGTDAVWLLACLSLGIAILFNAIPEMILWHRGDGLGMLASSSRFIRENWIEWFLPLLILMLPWLIVLPKALLLTFSGLDPLLPTIFLVNGIRLSARLINVPPLLAVFLALILGHWFMIFRSLLFKELETGTRRRRMFRAKNG